MSLPVSEEDLQAYVDDALGEAERSAVELYLAQRPDEAARVRDYVVQRATLRTALALPAAAPVPPGLNLLRLTEARIGRRRAMWRLAAMLVLGLGVGGGAGWLWHGGMPTDRAGRAMAALTDQALASHAVYAADPRHPIELGAAERDQLARWLSNRLDRNVEPPYLERAGYQLLGGRLLATERGGAAALFVYADKRGQRVSVLLRPMAAAIRAARTDVRNGSLTACGWIEGGLGYAVAGPIADEELDGLADLIAASARGPA